MAVDPDLLEKAAEILGKDRFSANSALEDAVDYLAGFPPFEEMDDEELEPLVDAALARMPAAAPARPRRPGGPAHAGKPTPKAERKVPDGLHPSAPYRFVALPDTVVMADSEPPAHDWPVPGGFCAEIAVTWAAETPLLIGKANEADNVVEPLCLGGEEGAYVIPGASLRGMIRAAMEIVAHGRLGTANLHHRYGLRDFEHPAYANRSPVSRVKEVKAGWLQKAPEDGAWQITPCDWAHVLIEDLLETSYGRWERADRSKWIGRSLADKYGAVGMKSRDGPYDFSKTFGFSAAPDDNGRAVVKPSGSHKGTLVFSNKLPGQGGKKKFEYVLFPPAPGAEPVPIKPELVETFQRLYSKPSKNRPTPDGSWKDLSPTFEAGQRLPVFYVGDLDRQDERFMFGLTRLFKIPHERSVAQVLEAQAQHLPGPIKNDKDEVTAYNADFVEALFGYVMEADALGLGKDARIAPDAAGRKGRIAFSFAHLDPNDQETKVSEPIHTVMMAPRASFAPYYLKSPAEKDYSAEQTPRLAGRKRYLPRWQQGQATEALEGIRAMGQKQLESIKAASRGKSVSEDVQSRLRFLMPKEKGGVLTFSGTIRLHNVTAAELGAVLFALTHGGDPAKPYRHMLGRAKPFGAGQMRVVTARLSVTPNDQESDAVKPPESDEIANTTDPSTGFCPPPKEGEPTARNASHRPFLKAFIERMQKEPGLRAFPDVPAVREFLGASDPAETAKQTERLTYQPLSTFNELRKVTKPLKPHSNGTPAPAPPRFPDESKDGRLLAAPATQRKIWRG